MPISKLRPSFTLTEDRLRELQAVVPEAFADGRINWDTLREALGETLEDETKEHFGLFWPGKREARRLAALPSKGTLIPQPGAGVDEDSTHNLFIEGDNLEVLKLLQKSYAGRVKMIYIDPPYNTGKDFIYSDDFVEPLEAYLSRTEQADEAGQLLTSNPKVSGRFHSIWLNMIYPRLKLAKELLTEDGLIFVSIGDNEIHHLKSLMNEVFGEENFVAQFIWNTEGHTDNQFQVKVNHEYILLYAKSSETAALGFVVDPNTREESNLWKGFAENSITKNGPANPCSEVTLPIGFPCKENKLNLPPTEVAANFYKDISGNGYISRAITKKYEVSYPIRKDPMIVKDGKLTQSCRVFSGWANVNKLKEFINKGCVPVKDEAGDTMQFYLSENGVIYYRKDRERARNILSVLRNMGTTEKMRSDLESLGVIFQYPKPKELLKYLLKIGLDGEGIVLDFFAGSCTTAHALLELNLEVQGSRKFIMVQLPEPISKTDPAYQKGYRNIAQIGQDRIRKIGKELKKANKDQLGLFPNLDMGFKAYELSNSHFVGWEEVSLKDISQLELRFDQAETPLVEGWKSENLLTEILLLQGFPLDSSVKALPEFKTNEVKQVTSEFVGHHLYVCLDKKVKAETVAKLSLRAEDILVCLDSALSDEAKVNLADRCNLKVI